MRSEESDRRDMKAGGREEERKGSKETATENEKERKGKEVGQGGAGAERGGKKGRNGGRKAGTQDERWGGACDHVCMSDSMIHIPPPFSLCHVLPSAAC